MKLTTKFISFNHSQTNGHTLCAHVGMYSFSSAFVWMQTHTRVSVLFHQIHSTTLLNNNVSDISSGIRGRDAWRVNWFRCTLVSIEWFCVRCMSFDTMRNRISHCFKYIIIIVHVRVSVYALKQSLHTSTMWIPHIGGFKIAILHSCHFQSP